MSVSLAPVRCVVRRDAVLVIGPALSGATSLARVLRDRFPERRFVERLPAGEGPTAIVFVVSATAPVVASDCHLLDSAAAVTDLMIGVVSKIDVHRGWRDVLKKNRNTLDAHFECRRRVHWVGASAAPDLGEPDVEALVETITSVLFDGDLARRNELRASQSWLMRLERERADALNALGAERDAVVRARRLARSEQSIALRTEVQQSRVHLLDFARGGCVSTRATLRNTLVATPRCDLAAFPHWAAAMLADLAVDVVREADRRVGINGPGLNGLGTDSGVPRSPIGEVTFDTCPTPPRPSRQEAWLATLIGAGFGIGLALTIWRLLAGIAPDWSLECGVGCAGTGLALAIWTIRARRLIHDRGVLDRWVGDVVDRARTALEGWVSRRMLEVDAEWSEAAAERDAHEGLLHSKQLAVIDRAVRSHPRIPAIQQALAAINSELADLVGSSPVPDFRPRIIGNNPD